MSHPTLDVVSCFMNINLTRDYNSDNIRYSHYKRLEKSRNAMALHRLAHRYRSAPHKIVIAPPENPFSDLRIEEFTPPPKPSFLWTFLRLFGATVVLTGLVWLAGSSIQNMLDHGIPTGPLGALVNHPDLAVGYWYSMEMPDGKRLPGCYQGKVPSEAGLPQKHALGDMWKALDNGHYWIWMAAPGASVPAWIDP